MNALTPLAVSNADVLRALKHHLFPTVAALAQHVSRDPDNLRKTLKSLQTAGLVDDQKPVPTITAAGTEALGAIERAENPLAAGAGPAGFVELYHAQILPDPANARRDWETPEAKEDLEALAESIAADGLLHPLIVGPQGDEAAMALWLGGAKLPWHTLIGGERRWRAIGSLIETERWPKDRKIPCRIRDDEGVALQFIALADNLQRRALNPLEEAKAFKRLRDQDVETVEIARRVGVTPRQVQMRLQLLELSEADQARLILPKDDPDYLSATAARALLQTPRAREEEPPARVAAPEHPALTPYQVMLLGEMCAVAAQRGKDRHGYSIEFKIRHFPDAGGDRELGALIGLGLVGFDSGYDPKAFVTLAGRSAWERAKNPLAANPLQIAREAAGVGPVELEALEPGEHITPWLNLPKPAKPVELDDATALTLLELHAAGIRSNDGGRAEIAWDAPKSELEALRKASHVWGGEHPDWSTRRYYVRLGQGPGVGLNALIARHLEICTKDGKPDKNAIELVLKALRSKVLGERGKKELKGAYATSWLNGPFELSPDEQKRAGEREAQKAERAAQDKAREEARAAAEAALTGIEAEARAGVPFGFGETLKRLWSTQHPLPWAWDGDSDAPALHDANGTRVPLHFSYRAGPFARLLLLAVNAAAELPTPPALGADESDTEDDQDEEA